MSAQVYFEDGELYVDKGGHRLLLDSEDAADMLRQLAPMVGLQVSSAGTDEVIYTVTRGAVQGIAGREVTDDEVSSIVKALDFGDDLTGVVLTVCGSPDDEDEDHPEHIDCAIGCRLDINHDGACRERRGGEPICDNNNHVFDDDDEDDEDDEDEDEDEDTRCPL